MSTVCAILFCKRLSCALCHCCQQNICLSHLKEHQDLLISQLNPLVDQINTLGNRLKTINIEDRVINARQKLEEWRVHCHQIIEHVFQKKCQELDGHIIEKVNKQREEVSRIQFKAAELIHEQQASRGDLDLLTLTIDNLEREMNKIEQTSFNIRCQSLEIDENWIEIKELSGNRVDLSSLSKVYKTIDYCHGSSSVVASNDQMLLMHQKPNLCLVDRHLKAVKDILWNNGHIKDMCWSSVLDKFIIITKTNAFLVDQSKLIIEKISAIQGDKWFSCTCSDKSLYLSTNNLGSSIIEYCLLPSMELITHWESPNTCPQNEIISQIRSHGEVLALMITKPDIEVISIELKTSKTFQKLWSCELNMQHVPKKPFFCCLINGNEWLVADHETSRLIHITNDGKIKATCTYNPVPYHLCMFGSDLLGVIHETGINFHTL